MITNDIGWFDQLSKEIGEQGVVAMMVLIEARKIARLLASTAKNQDTAENDLFPIATNVLTTLVANQLSTSVVKEQYYVAEMTRQSKAAIDEAVSRYQREEQTQSAAREPHLWERR